MAAKKRFWTTQEVEQLTELYPNHSTQHIAKLLGFKPYQVYNKAFALGLKKSTEYMEALNVLCGQHVAKAGASTQFKKGIEVWNKGKTGYMGANKTSFKKGNIPANYKDEGTERIIDGYIEVKRGLNEWIPKQRLVWEQTHGAIPKGHKVIFADGNRRNFDLNNLILVSCAELMQRNSIHRFPKELKQAIRAYQKLKKIIRNHGKKQN